MKLNEEYQKKMDRVDQIIESMSEQPERLKVTILALILRQLIELQQEVCEIGERIDYMQVNGLDVECSSVGGR